MTGRIARDDTLRNGFQHQLHLVNLGRLIRVDVRRESEHRFVVTSIAVTQELSYHVDRALMVSYHAGEKETVERRTACLVERRHLVVGEHAGHQDTMGHSA